jgi:CrcB protein
MAGDLTLRAFLLVAAGAVAGAALRWITGVHAPRGFPWATVLVNGVGSFLVGLLLFGGLAKGWLGEDARLLLGVGFLGALTTMSAFAYETVAALDEGAWGRAALVFLANPVLSVAAALLGRLTAHALPAAS